MIVDIPQELNSELYEQCTDFLDRYAREKLSLAAQRGADSIEIPYSDLFQGESDLAEDLINHPDTILGHLTAAARAYDIPLPGATDKLEEINVRISGVDTRDITVSELRNDAHRNKYLGVRGQVAMASQVQPKIISAMFVCERCTVSPTDPYLVGPVPQHSDEVRLPEKCPSCEKTGPFSLSDKNTISIDHQIVELRELPGDNPGAGNNAIPVHLYDDLAGGVTAGDRVRVNGLIGTEKLIMRANQKAPTRRPWKVEANAIDPEQRAFSDIDPERIDEIKALSKRDTLVNDIIDSIAPNVITGARGDKRKLALALQQFGGNRDTDEKGDINIFLIGDPGTAKSQYLQRMYKLAPKSVEASGKGATAAGLTATARKSDYGEGWMLDAGALVLGSGGLACIDEFDKMDDSARKSMHEAMENQRVPITKAGISTTLPTETAVLAAANPIGGNYDRMGKFYEQVNLESPLIQRFDLIFVVTDQFDEQRDREIATHQHSRTNEEVEKPIDDDLLTQYIAYARQNVNPQYRDPDVKEKAVNWYVKMREKTTDQDDYNPKPGVGPRSNDGIRRLSQASARMRLSDVIEMQDVERAIELKMMDIGDRGLDSSGDVDRDDMNGYDGQTMRTRMKNALSHDEWQFPRTIGRRADVSEEKTREILKKYRNKDTLPVEEKNGKWKLS